MPIRFLDMFAGIGGFRSGLERLSGFECVGYCEIDKYAKQAYDAMYPTKGELYFADARTIDPYTLPDIDLICGGFPCQSFSIAGLGRRTADCIGLIKGYGWLNTQTGAIEYGTNGMPDICADTMFENVAEKGTIDTLPKIPGLALWHSGHIGIYIGDAKVIHAANTQAGVIISDVSGSGFTHWLKIPYITYLENTE